MHRIMMRKLVERGQCLNLRKKGNLLQVNEIDKVFFNGTNYRQRSQVLAVEMIEL
jgi:hypothetical protein